jgi:hypothetical protein
MPALRDLQAGFRAAVLTGDEARVAGEIVADGLDASARLAVYRHHVFTSLTAALEATFPVVCRLVDRRFFGYAADAFIRAHPPLGPCLFEYGAAFPDFLAQFPACRHLEYLADVARMEWAMNVALYAPDTPVVEAQTLAALPAETVLARAFRLHPSVTLLRSSWPLERIWRANQPDADPDATVDLGVGATWLQVWRPEDDVLFRALTPAGFALREALTSGGTLAGAAQAALDVGPTTDVVALVREALATRILVVAG